MVVVEVELSSWQAGKGDHLFCVSDSVPRGVSNPVSRGVSDPR